MLNSSAGLGGRISVGRFVVVDCWFTVLVCHTFRVKQMDFCTRKKRELKHTVGVLSCSPCVSDWVDCGVVWLGLYGCVFTDSNILLISNFYYNFHSTSSYSSNASWNCTHFCRESFKKIFGQPSKQHRSLFNPFHKIGHTLNFVIVIGFSTLTSSIDEFNFWLVENSVQTFMCHKRDLHTSFCHRNDVNDDGVGSDGCGCDFCMHHQMLSLKS